MKNLCLEFGEGRSTCSGNHCAKGYVSPCYKPALDVWFIFVGHCGKIVAAESLWSAVGVDPTKTTIEVAVTTMATMTVNDCPSRENRFFFSLNRLFAMIRRIIKRADSSLASLRWTPAAGGRRDGRAGPRTEFTAKNNIHVGVQWVRTIRKH